MSMVTRTSTDAHSGTRPDRDPAKPPLSDYFLKEVSRK